MTGTTLSFENTAFVSTMLPSGSHEICPLFGRFTLLIVEKLHQIKPDDTGFDELIELNYSAKKDSPITAAQRKYLIALTEKHGLEPVEDIDALTKSRASKLIDNIISNYGK